MRACSPCICRYLGDKQLDSNRRLSLRLMYHGPWSPNTLPLSLSLRMQIEPHLKRQQADLRPIAMSHTQCHMQALHQLLQGCGSLTRMPHLQWHHAVLDKARSTFNLR